MAFILTKLSKEGRALPTSGWIFTADDDDANGDDGDSSGDGFYPAISGFNGCRRKFSHFGLLWEISQFYWQT